MKLPNIEFLIDGQGKITIGRIGGGVPCAAVASDGSHTMITGAIKSQIDQIWNAFWSGGISNPLEVIEQITYLLFLRTLGGDDSTYSHHMKDARFTIPTAARLAKVVDLLDNVPMEDRDTKVAHRASRPMLLIRISY